MRLVLTIDGERVEAGVDPARSTVEIRGHTVPVRLIASEESRIELEVAGERIVLDGWPRGRRDPRPRVSVNGEWVAVELVDLPQRTMNPVPFSASPRSEPPTAPTASVSTGEGVPVFPPMPGRILEVHVTEGVALRAGALLFVLEAMKMRNEITSPVAGRAVGLAVTVGSNVRARDVLLRIVPDGGSR